MRIVILVDIGILARKDDGRCDQIAAPRRRWKENHAGVKFGCLELRDGEIDRPGVICMAVALGS